MKEFKITYLGQERIRTEFVTFDTHPKAVDYAFENCRENEQVANVVPTKF